MTEQDELDEQERIAEFVENELAREIWMAEADWLSLEDFLAFIPNRTSAAIAALKGKRPSTPLAQPSNAGPSQ